MERWRIGQTEREMEEKTEREGWWNKEMEGEAEEEKIAERERGDLCFM